MTGRGERHRFISRALMAADYTLVKTLERVRAPQHRLARIVFTARKERLPRWQWGACPLPAGHTGHSPRTFNGCQSARSQDGVIPPQHRDRDTSLRGCSPAGTQPLPAASRESHPGLPVVESELGFPKSHPGLPVVESELGFPFHSTSARR